MLLLIHCTKVTIHAYGICAISSHTCIFTSIVPWFANYYAILPFHSMLTAVPLHVTISMLPLAPTVS